LIAEGLALIDKAVRHGRPGPYQVQAAIAALHARAVRPEDTELGTDLISSTVRSSGMAPSPVVSLNRAVAVSKVRAGCCARDDRAAFGQARGLFLFHGARGAFLKQLGRSEEARIESTAPLRSPIRRAEAAHIRLELDRLADGGGTRARSESRKKFPDDVSESSGLGVLEHLTLTTRKLPSIDCCNTE